MSDKTTATEYNATVVCIGSGIGIIASMASLIAYPCWPLTYAVCFFAFLYCTAMVAATIAWTRRVINHG
jgi:hypothetical protein